MKVEVLENGDVTLDSIVLKSSMIKRMNNSNAIQWCDIDDYIDCTEKYMDMIIDQNDHDEMPDITAIGMIRYFRKIKSILLDLKPA